MRRNLMTIPILLTVAGLAACEPRLEHQPKYKDNAPSDFFADGAVARPRIPGTLPFSATTSSRTEITMDLLREGRELYSIHCEVCHGAGGNGDGMAVQRGFPAPDPLGNDSIRRADAADLERTLRDGKGRMRSFGASLDEQQRWAVIAYVRALQIRTRLPADRLANADRERLARGAR